MHNNTQIAVVVLPPLTTHTTIHPSLPLCLPNSSFKPCIPDLNLNRSLVSASLTPCKYFLNSTLFSQFYLLSSPSSNFLHSLSPILSIPSSHSPKDTKRSSIPLPHVFISWLEGRRERGGNISWLLINLSEEWVLYHFTSNACFYSSDRGSAYMKSTVYILPQREVDTRTHQSNYGSVDSQVSHTPSGPTTVLFTPRDNDSPVLEDGSEDSQ